MQVHAVENATVEISLDCHTSLIEQTGVDNIQIHFFKYIVTTNHSLDIIFSCLFKK